MTTPVHSSLGTESDSLLTQIHIGNVLQVRNVLLRQQMDIEKLLTDAKQNLQLGRAGGDPISADVTPLFQAKIDQLLSVHWAHVHELTEATERLRQAALHYGFTDDEVDDSFRSHDLAVGPLAYG